MKLKSLPRQLHILHLTGTVLQKRSSEPHFSVPRSLSHLLPLLPLLLPLLLSSRHNEPSETVLEIVEIVAALSQDDGLERPVEAFAVWTKEDGVCGDNLATDTGSWEWSLAWS